MAVSVKQAAMADRRARVVSMRVEQASFADIASELGISESTARADYSRALSAARSERNALAGLAHAAEMASLDAQEQAAWKVLRSRHVAVHAGQVVTRRTGWERDPVTEAIERDAEGMPIGIYEEVEDDSPVLAAIDRLGRIGERRAELRGESSDAVEAAMRNQISAMDDEVRTSPLAQAAVRLAAQLDAGMSPRDAAAVTRELRMVVAELQERSPAKGEVDTVDELRARRAARAAAAGR